MKALECKTLGAELSMHTIGETAITPYDHYFLTQLVHVGNGRQTIQLDKWTHMRSIRFEYTYGQQYSELQIADSSGCQMKKKL